MEKGAHIYTPRRVDRAVADQAWLAAMLHSAPYATLGTIWEAQPFVKPTLFAYDETGQVIYFHSAQEGRTCANLEANPNVCLCVSEMGRLLPAKTAMGFSVEYSSVIVFGKVHIVMDPAESRYGLQILLDKYFPHLTPGEDYRPVLPDEIARTAVYRLEIEHMSGKKNRGKADHPGAFFYGEQPA